MRKKWNVAPVRAAKGREKLGCCTAYDACFARLADEAGVPILLVGDSMGMTALGYQTTLPVTMGEMLSAVAAVAVAAAVFLHNALGYVLGYAAAAAAGFTESRRRTLSIEVGMQNAAQAIAIASSPFIFNSNEMAIPAIIYALFMNVILLVYVAIIRKKREL